MQLTHYGKIVAQLWCPEQRIYKWIRKLEEKGQYMKNADISINLSSVFDALLKIEEREKTKSFLEATAVNPVTILQQIDLKSINYS